MLKPADTITDLARETESARALRANLLDAYGDDQQLVADMIEGETDLHGAIKGAVALVQEDEDFVEQLKARIEKDKARISRLEVRAERTRAAITVAMEVAAREKKPMRTAYGTVTLRNTPLKAEITNESQIPTRFEVLPPPKIDKAKLLAELKENAEKVKALGLLTDLSDEERAARAAELVIPGAQLSTPSKTIAIRA